METRRDVVLRFLPRFGAGVAGVLSRSFASPQYIVVPVKDHGRGQQGELWKQPDSQWFINKE